MVVILPVFRAILTGAGTLLALHLANPHLPEPLHELAFAGAKELVVFGANALAKYFDIFAWLIGTGAAWNSIRLAEQAKHALGHWYEAGEHHALHPARAIETLEENAKWLSLLNVTLPNCALHDAFHGKELMVVPQPCMAIDICIPGEVGFWNADAAAAFEAALGDTYNVCIVPGLPGQGVCVAGHYAAAFSTSVSAATFFQVSAKIAAVAVPNSIAIVVEPAIAGGHVAQLINTSNAGSYIGPQLNGHILNGTSASANAPLAVPGPAAAVNVTEVYALVH